MGFQGCHISVNFIKKAGDRRAIITNGFAENQIIGLNCGCAFIDWQNAGIAIMLGGAGFFDKAHAAMNLQRIRGDLLGAFGHPTLDHGNEQTNAGFKIGLFSVTGMTRLIHRCRANHHQGAHCFDFGFHRAKKPQNIGVMNDGIAFFTVKRHALNAVTSIGFGLLIGAFRNGKTLQADRKTGVIHHAKHDVDSLIFLTDKIANGTIGFTILHNRGWRSLDAKFFLNRQTAKIIRLGEIAIIISKEFRHDKHRNTLDAIRRIGCACQHQMNDILGHIMLAIGDIDFLARNQIMIPIGNRAAFDASKVGAGLRFGQIHRSGPAAFNHWRDKDILQFRACRFLQGIDLPLRQKMAKRKGHIGRLP